MKTALVLGGAGFLGRHLIPKLLDRGYEVHSVDNAEAGPVGFHTVSDKSCLHHMYSETFENWKQTFSVRFDYVFHLAASLTKCNIDERNKMGIAAFADIQLDYSVAQWLAAYPPKERVVWMSSCATDAKDTENYAFVKYVSERYARTLGRNNFPISILRPYSGYGPGQGLNYPMPAIIDRALRHENPLIVWGNKFTVRDWIYVDDIVDAMLLAADGKFPNVGSIPIGTGRGVRFTELAEMIAKEVGYSPTIQADHDKPVGSTYRVATTGIAKNYGFEAKVTLEDGIARCVAARRKELETSNNAAVARTE